MNLNQHNSSKTTSFSNTLKHSIDSGFLNGLVPNGIAAIKHRCVALLYILGSLQQGHMSLLSFNKGRKCFVLACTLLLSVSLTAQRSLDSLFKPGTRITYRLNAGEKFYDVAVTIKSIHPALTYDWLINDSANASGSISLSPKAVETGTAINHSFMAGDQQLDDKTTGLILSEKLYKRLSRRFKKPTTLYLHGSDSAAYAMGTYTEPKDLNIKVNGTPTVIKEEMVRSLVKLARKYTNTGEEFFTFYKSPAFPLILRMKIDPRFSLEIIEIISE